MKQNIKTEYAFLLLWEGPDEAPTLEILRDRAEKLLGATGRSKFSEALGTLLSARLIQLRDGTWKLTKEGIRLYKKIQDQKPRYNSPPMEEQLAAERQEGTFKVLESPDANENAKNKEWENRPFQAGEEYSGGANVISRVCHSSKPDSSVHIQTCSDYDLLRKLIAYYIDCARYDERPSSTLYRDDYNRLFIPLVLRERWWIEEQGQSVSLKIPVRAAQSDFMRIWAKSHGEDFFIGYPIFVIPPRRDGDDGLIIPIFCIPAVLEQQETSLNVTPLFDEADVNGEWLQRHFQTSAERHEFLRASGLIDPDDDSLQEISNDFLDIRKAIGALTLFCGKNLVDERLAPDCTRPMAGFCYVQRGIYNTAILYSARRLTYNAGLVKELRQILRTATEDDLKKTALWQVFCRSENVSHANHDTLESSTTFESDPIPFLPFNYEQEQAIGKALSSTVTVITGPPGTGKSQVAANLLANLAAAGRSAIFASRNHKALDAVVPRVNALVNNLTVIFRTKAPDTGEVFSWKNAINEILSSTGDLSARSKYDQLLSEVCDLVKQRRRLLGEAERWTVLERSLGKLQRHWDDQTDSLSEATLRKIREGTGLLSEKVCESTIRLAEAFPRFARHAWLLRLRQRLWFLVHRSQLRRILPEIHFTAQTYDLPSPVYSYSCDSMDNIQQVTETLRHYAALHNIHRQIQQLQSDSKSLKPLSEIREELELLLARITQISPLFLEVSLRCRLDRLSPEKRARLIQMRNTLSADANAPVRWQRFFEERFAFLVECFPLWAIPNLSARHGLPLAPGIVDTVVLDEASQCDIASAIPLLYRARRAVVIGDPNQLRPVHTMKIDRNNQLKRKHGLVSPDYAQYDFLQSTLYELGAVSSAAGNPILLRDHFRCHPKIAAYFNTLVYNGQLRILTDTTRLKVPKSRKPGILWTNVVGTAEEASPSGAICMEEIEAIGLELTRLISDEQFDGTIGVVTPFREQAKRIGDWASAKFPAEALRRAQFVAATADGFQGDQRDVILCSPVYQPGVPRGSEWFITSRESQNLWNVALSRAKALLHIFGNQELCRNSQALHLRLLADPPQVETDPTCYVFESVWERRLYDACKKAGLSPVPQYPLAGCRLDLAFPEARLDVEVDGERYHRDAAGRRKAEDLWRDMTIRATGWTPLRFWVYELRENMESCVQRIKQHIDSTLQTEPTQTNPDEN